MAVDRQSAGVAVLRVFLGVFFVFEGLGKIRWLGDPSILAGQLGEWSRAAAPGSISQVYLAKFAVPGAAVFARLVPIGEITCGTALIAGFWTPLFALVAFLMALNFHIASGALFKYGFLTNGYGLPVLGGTLALVFAGGRKAVRMKVKPAK
jgi:uncharacterized membrane protein YphA (DoxX/SURF4 family)